MASVSSDSGIVSISCYSKTLVIRLNDSELYSFVHSDINEKNGQHTNEANVVSQPSNGQNESEEFGIGLACCDISANGKQLAFCTLTKNLCIVNISDDKPSVTKVYNLIRGASKVRFTPSNHVVVADKSGDVYLFMPETDSDSGELILGHLSLLLDVLVTPDEKYVVTCDRDEKIRVSSFPNGYNIIAFCLGHSEFVSSLSLLPHNQECLISTSGDGTFRFWDYKIGVELAVCNTSQYINVKEGTAGENRSEGNIAVITDAASILLDSLTSLICVTLGNFSACLVFKCKTDNETFNCNLIQNIPLENCHPWRVSLSSNVLWLVLSCDDIVIVNTKSFDVDQCKFHNDVPCNVEKATQILNSQKLAVDKKKNVIDLLFKRKFENVQDYLKRKEQRLFVQEAPNKKVKA